MSTPHRTDPTTAGQVRTTLSVAATRAASSLADRVVAGTRALAFWSAVLLPMVYVPLLVGGLRGAETTYLAALLVANAVAFVVGHEHDPGRDR